MTDFLELLAWRVWPVSVMDWLLYLIAVGVILLLPPSMLRFRFRADLRG